MSKFNIGDRVVSTWIETPVYMKVGTILDIIDADSNWESCTVRFDRDGAKCRMYATHFLEFESVASSPLYQALKESEYGTEE